MPGTAELIGLVAAVFIVWFVFKLVKMAVRLTLLIIGLVMIVGALYWLFAR
jgi:hypothetical protein